MLLDPLALQATPRLLPVALMTGPGGSGEASSVPPAGGGATSLPTDDDLVDATLHLVVELARTTVGGADGVSVSLRRHGRLATAAASDQTVLDMDTQQYATGEGPCVDASNKGRWFHSPSLAAEVRWPAFTPKAMALGIRAILSSPLVTWGQPVGAINIYSHRPLAFAADDQRLAMKFATEASALLADAGVDVPPTTERSERFQASLRSREIIAQAQGVIDGAGRPHRAGRLQGAPRPLATHGPVPPVPGPADHRRLHPGHCPSVRPRTAEPFRWLKNNLTTPTGTDGTPGSPGASSGCATSSWVG